MHLRDFSPCLDGLSSGIVDVPVPPEFQPDAQLLEKAYLDTLTYLDTHYKGAIRHYRLDVLIKVWKQPATLKADLLDNYKLYVILDHYHARLSVSNSLKKGRENNRLWPYLKERANDCFKVETAARLKVIAIYRLMPDSWVREEKIKQLIIEKISGVASVKDPDIDFDLKIARSGRSWMNATTLSEWEKLRAGLDHHQPQIVNYIVETNDYSHRTRSGIAYAYQILKNSKVKINIYQPSKDKDLCLTIDLARHYHYFNDKRIAGFYISDYQPKSVPIGMVAEDF